MSSDISQAIQRFNVDANPLIRHVMKQLGIRELISDAVASYGNETIPVVDIVLLMVCNITTGRIPLYGLPQWARSVNPHCLGFSAEQMQAVNDDRLARALDKLYYSDRASLMTKIVVRMARRVQLDMARVHNDSTTVKAYGNIPGKTRSGLELKRGHSKDHRPDLKQLLFSLTISADGAVPIHYKTYPGNRTDDTTHIETWNTIKEIAGTPGFLYVADCKVCTTKQLRYIQKAGGRVITIVPETWGETKRFKEALRLTGKPKKRIMEKSIPGHGDQKAYYSLYTGTYTSSKDGYTMYWYHSSEKQKQDRLTRETRLRKAERELTDLAGKLNKRRLKTKEAIEEKIEGICRARGVTGLYVVSLVEMQQVSRVQIGKGRPGPNTQYKMEVDRYFSLTWKLDKEVLRAEKRLDGVFPLLTTDNTLSAKEVLLAYKYQPRLEKRFTQFKSVHEAAPLLFKKIERVEAIMFLFFLALMVQALIERKIRGKMKEHDICSLPLYPEFREAAHPTTAIVLGAFEGLSSYKVELDDGTVKEFRDSLSETQLKILEMLNIEPEQYWGNYV